MQRQVFKLPTGDEITNLVATKQEFRTFCNKIVSLVDPDDMKKVLETGMIPGITRDPRTQPLFEYLNVSTDIFSICTEEFLRRMKKQKNMQQSLGETEFRHAWASFSQEERNNIHKTIENITYELKNGSTTQVECVLRKFIEDLDVDAKDDEKAALLEQVPFILEHMKDVPKGMFPDEIAKEDWMFENIRRALTQVFFILTGRKF